MGAPTPVMDGMNGHIPHPGKSTPTFGSPTPVMDGMNGHIPHPGKRHFTF